MPPLKRAEQLDPLSPLPHSFTGFAQLLLRRPEQAVESLRKAVELAPGFSMAHNLLGWALFNQGKSAEALAEAEQAYQLVPLPINRAALGISYALTGRRREAQPVIEELKRLSANQYVSPYDIAIVYVALGDKDQAFAWLEKAREDQSESLGFMKWNSALDALRADPRFADLLRRVGLAQ